MAWELENVRLRRAFPDATPNKLMISESQTPGLIAVDHIRNPKIETFYCIAILVSKTLGKALGDFLADVRAGPGRRGRTFQNRRSLSWPFRLFMAWFSRGDIYAD